ncbi:hypothetical protein BB561_001228 [Smittium simulii]|uniref:Nuclear rim protein 1 n=1 Tax=Smittium simulii TaxID=133385 RepID=A0A2T9YVL5_9FUNG|nr:hypothetical protein BB561_001228 [Smittium simulii]
MVPAKIPARNNPSLFARFYDSIGDSYLKFITKYDDDDLERFGQKIKWIVVILLYSAFVIIHFSRLYDESERAKIEKIFISNQKAYKEDPQFFIQNSNIDFNSSAIFHKTTFSQFLVFVEFTLILSSIITFIFAFSSTKSYQIRSANKEEYKNVNRMYKTSEKSFSSRQKSENSFYELYVWEPSGFWLFLACWWSPLHLVIAFLADNTNWHYAVLILILASFQTQFFVLRFTELNTHKKIITEQVYNEYNTSFVYPRLFKKTRDVATETENDDMLISLNDQSNLNFIQNSDSPHRFNNITIRQPSAIPRDYLTDINSPISRLKPNSKSSSGNRSPYIKKLISTSSPLFARKKE